LNFKVKFLLALSFFSSGCYANDLYEPTTENLVQAIMVNDVARLQNLIRQGVNVNAKYDFRYPIHIAATYGSSDILRLLIADDINLDREEDYSRETPLHLTVAEANEELTSIFVASGANPNLIDANGDTALHLASKSLALTKLLLSSNAIDPNVGDKDHRTALMRAAGNSTPDANIVDSLLRAAADPYRKDVNGLRALDYARAWLRYFRQKPTTFKNEILQEQSIIEMLTARLANPIYLNLLEKL
jgi:hypothetical protein